MRKLLLVIGAIPIALAVVAMAAAGSNRNYTTHLVGAEEVPPRDTPAQGQFIAHLSKDGTTLEWRLIASNIENVVAAHIHYPAPKGTNAPAVDFLFGPAPAGGGRTDGVLSEGSTAVTPALLSALNSGLAYVNVHTNDGVGAANTGPGDFPGGEIRGQILPNESD